MRKDIDIVASGYPSLDRIIRVESEPALGTTSIIRNDDNATVYYGGCNVNVTYICSRLGLRCAPLMRVGKDFADSGFRSFLEDAGTIMDGIELCATLRTHQRTAAIPVVLITASNNVPQQPMWDHCVRKPIDVPTLVRTVEALLHANA